MLNSSWIRFKQFAGSTSTVRTSCSMLSSLVGLQVTGRFHFKYLYFCHSDVPPCGHISKYAPPGIFKICQCKMSLGPNEVTASRIEAHSHPRGTKVALVLQSLSPSLCQINQRVSSLSTSRAQCCIKAVSIISLTLSLTFCSTDWQYDSSS